MVKLCISYGALMIFYNSTFGQIFDIKYNYEKVNIRKESIKDAQVRLVKLIY